MKFDTSESIAAPLMAHIIAQSNIYNDEDRKIEEIKKEKHIRKSGQLKEKIQDIKSSLNPITLRTIDLASEKGASTWLSVLPIKEQDFSLHKGDALRLRYSWPLPNQPQKCACGKVFNIDHAMICPKGLATQ